MSQRSISIENYIFQTDISMRWTLLLFMKGSTTKKSSRSRLLEDCIKNIPVKTDFKIDYEESASTKKILLC